MKAFLVILGLLIATTGGVITYRALYLDPRSTIVISDKGVNEVPNYTRIVGGTVLLVGGAALAFFGATRRVK